MISVEKIEEKKDIYLNKIDSIIKDKIDNNEKVASYLDRAQKNFSTNQFSKIENKPIELDYKKISEMEEISESISWLNQIISLCQENSNDIKTDLNNLNEELDIVKENISKLNNIESNVEIEQKRREFINIDKFSEFITKSQTDRKNELLDEIKILEEEDNKKIALYNEQIKELNNKRNEITKKIEKNESDLEKYKEIIASITENINYKQLISAIDEKNNETEMPILDESTKIEEEPNKELEINSPEMSQLETAENQPSPSSNLEEKESLENQEIEADGEKETTSNVEANDIEINNNLEFINLANTLNWDTKSVKEKLETEKLEDAEEQIKETDTILENDENKEINQAIPTNNYVKSEFKKFLIDLGEIEDKDMYMDTKMQEKWLKNIYDKYKDIKYNGKSFQNMWESGEYDELGNLKIDNNLVITKEEMQEIEIEIKKRTDYQKLIGDYIPVNHQKYTKKLKRKIPISNWIGKISAVLNLHQLKKESGEKIR